MLLVSRTLGWDECPRCQTDGAEGSNRGLAAPPAAGAAPARAAAPAASTASGAGGVEPLALT